MSKPGKIRWFWLDKYYVFDCRVCPTRIVIPYGWALADAMDLANFHIRQNHGHTAKSV